MENQEAPPIASAAAWSPTAAPSQMLPLLNFDDPEVIEALSQSGREAEAAPAEEAAPERPDRMNALRDIARKLRQAPDSEETLQMIIDLSCQCTGSDAGMLTITMPEHRQVVWGSALGAGPYISVQLRAGGPSFGELVLTRMDKREEYEHEEETFAELVAEYVAKAVGALRRGAVLSDEQQDFLDRVTGELRAPMASASNFLRVLLDGTAGPITEEQRGYLTAASSDTKRLLAMINDLLAVSRLRPPENREMESIPIGPWLRRVMRDHERQARGYGIELVLHDPGDVLIVKGVPSQLDMVMAHLLSNAMKFSDEGGRVELSAVMNEGMIRVTVEDHGIGFDPADANRMLDCFARAINAEAMRIPGIGLGLFLAAEIVKNHSGRLWLDTRRDEGTQAHMALMPAVTEPVLD